MADENPVCVQLGKSIEFAEKGIVSKTFHEAPGFKSILFCMARGQALSDHTAPFPAILQAVGGRGVVKLGQEEHAVEAPAWIYMPMGLNHAIRAETEFTFTLVLMKSGKQ